MADILTQLLQALSNAGNGGEEVVEFRNEGNTAPVTRPIRQPQQQMQAQQPQLVAIDDGSGQVAEPQQAPSPIQMQQLQALQQAAAAQGNGAGASVGVAGGNRSVPTASVAPRPMPRPEEAPIDGNAMLQDAAAATQQANDPVSAAVVNSGTDNSWMLPAAAAAAIPAVAVAAPSIKGTAVAPTAAAGAVIDPRAQVAKSNAIDAEYRVINDPMNLAAGDKSLAVGGPADPKKLTGPQANATVGDTTGKTALPAPAEKPAIAAPDATSGKTIAAESGVLDKARAKVYNFGGTDMWIQGNEVFDKSGKYVGQASKVFPPHVQGMMRTLGIIKRGK